MIKIFLVAILVLVNLNGASGEPSANYGVVFSPSLSHYAVITVQPVGNLLLIDGEKRFQVFDNNTGDLVWSVAKSLGDVSNLSLSDDGDYVVRVVRSIRKKNSGNTLSDEVKKDISRTEVVTFYKRGVVIKKYSMAELGIEPSVNQNDYLIYNFLSKRKIPLEYGDDLDRRRYIMNPCLVGHYISIALPSGSMLYFDITSGEVLKEPPQIFIELRDAQNIF